MKKLKKVLIALVLGITIFAGIKVNALTRNEEKNIAQHIWEAWYFFQLDLNDSAGIASYVGFEYMIPNKDDHIYKVPKEVYEGYISSHFVVDESWFEKFRVDFNEVSTNGGGPWWGYLIDPQYIEEDGQYYYKYQLAFGAGDGTSIAEIKGYKDLGNNYYQFYLLGAGYFGTEYRKNIYATYKIYYENNIVKFISAEELDENSFPRDDELILPEEEQEETSKFLEGANQKFDASKDKNLTFRIDAEFNLFDKVYINDKEVDSKNYTASEGSTVITFNDEYTKSLKNGKHNLKVTFTDGTSAETTFTIANSVDNTSTGLYTSLGIVATLGILGCAIVFINTRKHSKFPQV